MGFFSMELLQSFDTLPFLELYVSFTITVTLLRFYLDIRQLRAIQLPNPPKELAEVFDAKLYQKTQAYSREKWWFGFWHSLFSLGETLAILICGALPWLWQQAWTLVSSQPLEQLKQGRAHEITTTVVFFMLMMACNLVTELPWSLYSTFVVEQRHGFNTQTPGLFFMDMLKSMLLGVLIIPPVVATMTYILLVSGPWVALWLWGFLLTLSVVFMTIYPILIAPLFNKYESLEQGSLRSRIEALVGRVSFPLTKLYKVDGSKRSAHSNAYMYGFWNNKRIVLYDTLIQQCSEEQVEAVLAHELGHWKLLHTPVMFAVGQLVLLAQLCLFTVIRNSRGLFSSFGFLDAQPAFISFVLFQFLSAPMDEVMGLCSNVMSRTFEFQADRFAVSMGLGADLRAALLKLEEENKSAMNVDPWYSAYNYSHPPLVERVKQIDVLSKQAKKAQ